MASPGFPSRGSNPGAATVNAVRVAVISSITLLLAGSIEWFCSRKGKTKTNCWWVLPILLVVQFIVIFLLEFFWDRVG